MQTTFLDRLIASFVTTIIVLRLGVQSNLLNTFMGYTNGIGSVAGRFHPGTYLLIVPVALYFLSGRVRFVPLIDISIAAAAIAAGIALGNGGPNAASVIVDTELAGLLLARFIVVGSNNSRATILVLITALLLSNLPIVVYEKLTGIALIPRSGTEQYFRPQGFLDHPLTAGWTCCFGMWGVLKSDFRRGNAILINLLLLLEVVLCSVRLPLLLAGGLFALTLISLGGRSIARQVGATSLALVVGPVLVAVAVSLGLLDRFIDLGLYDDQSAASRLNSWSLLSQINNATFWQGMDNDSINALMVTNNIKFVENSFVMFTLLCGIVSATLVHFAVLLATSPAWRRSPSYLIVLTGVLIGSISVSTKSVVIVMAFVMVALFYERNRHGLARQLSAPATP